MKRGVAGLLAVMAATGACSPAIMGDGGADAATCTGPAGAPSGGIAVRTTAVATSDPMVTMEQGVSGGDRLSVGFQWAAFTPAPNPSYRSISIELRLRTAFVEGQTIFVPGETLRQGIDFDVISATTSSLPAFGYTALEGAGVMMWTGNVAIASTTTRDATITGSLCAPAGHPQAGAALTFNGAALHW